MQSVHIQRDNLPRAPLQQEPWTLVYGISAHPTGHIFVCVLRITGAGRRGAQPQP